MAINSAFQFGVSSNDAVGESWDFLTPAMESLRIQDIPCPCDVQPSLPVQPKVSDWRGSPTEEKIQELYQIWREGNGKKLWEWHKAEYDRKTAKKPKVGKVYGSAHPTDALHPMEIQK